MFVLLSLLACLISPVIGVCQIIVFATAAWGIRRLQPWAAIVGGCILLSPLLRLVVYPDTVALEDRLVMVILSVVLLLPAWFMFAGARSIWRPLRAPDTPWIAVAALLLTQPLCVRAYSMPTSSMEDTVQAGDEILVETVSPLLGRTLRRGDLVVFRYPPDPKQTHIKRIVGLPGDRLRIRGKRLYRNGAQVREDYARLKTEWIDPYRDNFPGQAGPAVLPRALNMLEKNVRDGELAVPSDQYFVLGDNRDFSLDSRYFGFITQADVIGRPFLIYESHEQRDPASPSRSIASLRWHRLLKRIH
jgi:signal peptidase I